MIKVLTLFGTRPEVVKLAPVIRLLEQSPESFQTLNVSSSQHTSLLTPFTDTFGIRVDRDLAVMRPDQTPSQVCARVLESLTPILQDFSPDIVLVQGDTSTAVSGALAAFHLKLPVGHVEAGLRSGNPLSPFPEEMNRRLISRLASLHFAATEHNRRTLLEEAVPEDSIHVTGNPVVDALNFILEIPRVPGALDATLAATEGSRRIVVTSHRRESLGRVMRRNLEVLRRFAASADDVTVIFPVHPNPSVVRAAQDVLGGDHRVHLIGPLAYRDFIHLLSRAWLIVSDSGGVQEEAPTLGKPVLILRENTERPEAIACGVARLVGGRPETLERMLSDLDRDPSWIESVTRIENPFGSGDSARKILDAIRRSLLDTRSEISDQSTVSVM